MPISTQEQNIVDEISGRRFVFSQDFNARVQCILVGSIANTFSFEEGYIKMEVLIIEHSFIELCGKKETFLHIDPKSLKEPKSIYVTSKLPRALLQLDEKKFHPGKFIIF